jgi:hypothetical protein
MNRKLSQVVSVLACALWLSASAWAANTVSVESRTADPGEADIELRVSLVNDVTLRTVAVPLAFRTVEGSAYMTSLKSAWGDRLPESFGQPLSSIVFVNTYYTEDGTCKDGFPGGFGTIAQNDTLDHPVPGSPIAVLFFRSKLISDVLPPGADTVGSMRLEFDLGPGQGSFEIDSNCVNPANHLLLIDNSDNQGIVPEFTKALITVGNRPVARDTAWSTNENTPHNVAYLPASDADGDDLDFAIVDGPFHGDVTGFDPSTGAFTYEPDPGYSGPDSLLFEATDGDLTSAPAVVRITVINVNDPPVARDTTVTTDEDVPVNGQLQAYDPDNGPSSLTYTRISGPIHGSITAFDVNTGAFTYEPDDNYNGNDAMTFRAFDGEDNSNQGSVQFIISAVNDPPVARDTSVSVPFETPVNAQLQAYDIDGPSLSFAVEDGPFHGAISGFNPATGEFTYTPDTSFSGPDSIKFTADDTFGPSNIGTVRLAVSSSDCICQCWGDPDCDGFQTPLDFVIVIQVVFENRFPTISQKCPTWDIDYDCSCYLDLLDVNKIIDVLFFNGELDCDPCGAACFPGSPGR